jgi:hypothetical protein
MRKEADRLAYTGGDAIPPSEQPNIASSPCDVMRE